jgi:dihydroorotate dehydrogenase
MYSWIRPALFAFEPESAHKLALAFGRAVDALGVTRLRSAFTHPAIGQEYWGLRFDNPVGIAAGLDKNAEHARLWQFLGAGFAEVGSVTAQPSVGNARPRAFRLPEDRAIINRMGLNNVGAVQVASRLSRHRRGVSIPLGINLAKTNDPSLTGSRAIDDFVTSFVTLAPLADYITLNVSCPNTKEGKTFERPDALEALLQEVMEARESEAPAVPVLVKFSPDGFGTEAELGRLVDIAIRLGVHGFVATNTMSGRPSLATRETRVAGIGAGGLSGHPLVDRADAVMQMLFRLTQGELPLIGVGGIDSPESAFRRILSGASLIQVYTGLVYVGPGLIRRISQRLPALLEKRGYTHIREAIGADA